MKRGMRSLIHALRMQQCDAAALEGLCDAIESCVNNVEQAHSASHSAKLSIGSYSRLLLMRYCQRLCDAVNEPSDVEKTFRQNAKRKKTLNLAPKRPWSSKADAIFTTVQRAAGAYPFLQRCALHPPSCVAWASPTLPLLARATLMCSSCSSACSFVTKARL